jgi:amidophosphoribosyltransferase
VLKAIDNNWADTVFSFIPNTAEVAFYGLMSALRTAAPRRGEGRDHDGEPRGQTDGGLLDDLILRNWPRGEKVVSKDIKIRTFIGQESMRNQLASHVYDITYGSVRAGQDNLVCVDDSIVRGTTLRRSILRILARLNPKKIVIVSTAPQIRYPDCYGIDMSEIGKFVAFEAVVDLLKESGRGELLAEVYRACRDEIAKKARSTTVRRLYEPFTPRRSRPGSRSLSAPRRSSGRARSRSSSRRSRTSMPRSRNHTGDWYFSGKYPTEGGYRVVNQAYVNYYEKNEGRSY